MEIYEKERGGGGGMTGFTASERVLTYKMRTHGWGDSGCDLLGVSPQNDGADIESDLSVVSEESGIAENAGMTPISRLGGTVNVTSPAVLEMERSETFPTMVIEWPDSCQPAATGNMAMALYFLKTAEGLLQIRPLPSIEVMRSWLEGQTREYHALGFPRDMWMSKLATIWEEFGRLYVVQRRKEKAQLMFQEKLERHHTLLTDHAETQVQAGVASEQLRSLQQRVETFEGSLERLQKDILLNEAQIAELRKSVI